MSVKLLEQWGYTLVDEITWVKKTINGKIYIYMNLKSYRKLIQANFHKLFSD